MRSLSARMLTGDVVKQAEEEAPHRAIHARMCYIQCLKVISAAPLAEVPCINVELT
jgi:hypothetical protein